MQTNDAEQLLRRIAPNMMAALAARPLAEALPARVNEFETRIIRDAIQAAGSLRKAAEKLGVPKSTLARKLKNQTGSDIEP